jgi:hypothetical protein
MVPVHPPGHGGEKRCEEIPLRPVSVLSASCRPVAPSRLLELCAAVRASALKSELVKCSALFCVPPFVLFHVRAARASKATSGSVRIESGRDRCREVRAEFLFCG